MWGGQTALVGFPHRPTQLFRANNEMKCCFSAEHVGVAPHARPTAGSCQDLTAGQSPQNGVRSVRIPVFPAHIINLSLRVLDADITGSLTQGSSFPQSARRRVYILVCRSAVTGTWHCTGRMVRTVRSHTKCFHRELRVCMTGCNTSCVYIHLPCSCNCG